VGARSDIFSLGVIFFELLFGDLPFGAAFEASSTADAADAILMRQQKGPPRRPAGAVGGRILRILDRCLSFDPRERFQSAAELAEALRNELSRPRRLQRWIATHRLPAAAAATLILAAAVGLTAFLAARDPYSVRQLHQGQAAFQQGDYDDALQHLNRSLDSNPSSPQALALRGQIHMERGDHIAAIADLKAAIDLNPDPKIMALIGYCCASTRYHSDATYWHRRAIESGFATAQVYNNLGYSYWKSARFELARQALKKAIVLEPNLQAVYHNLALLHFAEDQSKQRLPAEGLRQIELAIACGDLSGQLCRDAAAIAAYAGRFDATYNERALKYLRLAIEHDAPRDTLEREMLFADLLDGLPHTEDSRVAAEEGRRYYAEYVVNPLD
jgi:Flp pilus assembly protein TadD